MLSLTYDFTVGQPVRLLSGPFANQQGTVAKLSDDWGSVWVQDRGERVELITQLANIAPLQPTPGSPLPAPCFST
jgi:transcription antitermination factor NusG